MCVYQGRGGALVSGAKESMPSPVLSRNKHKSSGGLSSGAQKNAKIKYHTFVTPSRPAACEKPARALYEATTPFVLLLYTRSSTFSFPSPLIPHFARRDILSPPARYLCHRYILLYMRGAVVNPFPISLCHSRETRYIIFAFLSAVYNVSLQISIIRWLELSIFSRNN